MPEFFPVSPAPVQKSRTQTISLIFSLCHPIIEAFVRALLRAPDGFGKRAKLPPIPRSGRRHTFLHCANESVGECSWMNYVRETQLQLRDDLSQLLAIRQARGLDFCFTGIPCRYGDHVGPRCKTLINAMLFVQCTVNWGVVKAQTEAYCGKRFPRIVSRDRRTHGHCAHPASTVAASIGCEKWTCYLEQNLSTSRIPRTLQPSMSHACDYVPPLQRHVQCGYGANGQERNEMAHLLLSCPRRL